MCGIREVILSKRSLTYLAMGKRKSNHNAQGRTFNFIHRGSNVYCRMMLWFVYTAGAFFEVRSCLRLLSMAFQRFENDGIVIR